MQLILVLLIGMFLWKYGFKLFKSTFMIIHRPSSSRVDDLPTFSRRSYSNWLSSPIDRRAWGHNPPPRSRKAKPTQVFQPPDVSSIDFSFKGDDSRLRQRKPVGKQIAGPKPSLKRTAPNRYPRRGKGIEAQLPVDGAARVSSSSKALLSAAKKGMEAVVVKGPNTFTQDSLSKLHSRPLAKRRGIVYQ